jgi:hypothetical protein
MRSFGQSLVAGLFVLVGCADATFDLLPEAAPASTNHIGQSGETGSGNASGAGGFGAKGGTGSSGDPGGVGDETGFPCGPGGCPPPTCNGPGCVPCRTDPDCADVPGKPHCSFFRGCAECRLPGECPYGTRCDDCRSGDRCDDLTNRCLPDCKGQATCPEYLPSCDRAHDVCRQCDYYKRPCGGGLWCSMTGDCVECLAGTCPEAAPVCDLISSTCRECLTDEDCNYGPAHQCMGGRCITDSPPPPPPPNP